MAKKLHSFWRLLLGSFITLLGFTACKTTKKAQQGSDTEKLYGPPPVIKVDKGDNLIELYAPPPVLIEEEKRVMRLLYGPPPAKIKKENASKQKD